MSTRREFLTQAAAVTAASSLIAASVDAGTNPPKRKHKVPLRLGLVGVGQISPRYLKAAKRSDRARIIATCARTLESAKARAEEYGIESWFDDYQRMYDTIKPDAVFVATPTRSHAEISIAALERGIHVLCEKPMAMNLEECQAMAAAAQKSGAVLLVLPYEGGPPTRAILEHLTEAKLGTFLGAHSEWVVPGMSRTDWYYDGKLTSPAFGEMFVYPIATLVNLFGPAKRVTGFINTLIPQRIIGMGDRVDMVPPPRDPAKGRLVHSTAADNATLVLEWEHGQQSVARAMWGPSIIRTSTTIYGRHGTLWMTSKNFGLPEIVIHSPEQVIAGATRVGPPEEHCYQIPFQWADDLVEHFVDCILGLAKPKCGAEQALHVHEILYRGDEASRSGQTQALKTMFTPWHTIDPAFLDTRSKPI